MKALIITIGLIVFIAFWTYVGTVAFPFLAWLTGLGVVVLPAILLLFFSFCFLLGISLVPSRLFKRKIAKYILSVASPWFPVIILVLFSFDVLDIDPFLYAMMASCVLLLWCIFLVARRGYYYPFLWLPFVAVSIFTLTYIDENYGAHEYEGDYVLDRYGNNLYDRFGNKVFFKDYDEIEFVGDDKVRIEEWNDTRGDYDYGLYSLDKRRFIISMGETIRSCCSIEQRNGRSGIVADGGDMVVSYKYKSLEYWGDKAVGRDGDGGYVLLDELGLLVDDTDDFGEIVEIFAFSDKKLLKVRYSSDKYGIIDEGGNLMAEGGEDVTCYTNEFSTTGKTYYIFAGDVITVFSNDFLQHTTFADFSSECWLRSVYDYSSPVYYLVKLPSGKWTVVDGDGDTVISACEGLTYYKQDSQGEEAFYVYWDDDDEPVRYSFDWLRHQ